jgi:NAD(P)-dependent dehydrogenase (short-subunit alcohol dehydrogenase family)
MTLCPCATQRVMDVNFFAGVRITKALLPLLMDSKGRVVNVTSTAGFVGPPQVMPCHTHTPCPLLHCGCPPPPPPALFPVPSQQCCCRCGPAVFADPF